MIDYLIVGAGLYGAVCARELRDAGKSVLVIDKRDHIAGNVYTEDVEGIQVHKYGAHREWNIPYLSESYWRCCWNEPVLRC